MPTNKERTLNRTERLFAEVLLLQNRSDMSARDLADHFGVSRRTIFRDLRALGEAEVPLTYSEGGGYKILDGYQLPPLMLSAREAATLLMGTEFVKLQPEQSLRKDADEVALKIRQVLPEEVREFIDALNDRTVLDPYWLHSLQDAGEQEGRWYNISRAVAEQHPLEMSYYVPSRDELTDRKVDPLGLVYYTDHWNLVAYDHLREAIRNFRLDRIETMSVMGLEWFDLPEGFDLQAHLEEREESPANRRIRIRFTAREYQWARRGIPAQIEEERELEESGDVEVTFSFENLDYVARWLLRYGTRAEVIEPEDLRERMRDKAMEVAAQYPG